jgi:glyoxylase-like metal-dependent hydrolase (beta-lactamase superfamily II)
MACFTLGKTEITPGRRAFLRSRVVEIDEMGGRDSEPDPIVFDRNFSERNSPLTRLSPRVRRIVARNTGPFTFTGTCSYIVGETNVAIIDPGPADSTHLNALLRAVRGEAVRYIVVTHTHNDHSSAAPALKAATGAAIVGCCLYSPARPLATGEVNLLDAANDLTYAPDTVLSDGDTISGSTFTLTAVATPGHTMNHLSFALAEESALFSGDHVMAWSTSIVAPPDGAMGVFMASLDKLRTRDERIFWPGHGGPVTEPQRFVRALSQHRRHREASIMGRLRSGDRTIPEIVDRIYQNLDPRLLGAAALSVFAHLEDLINRSLVVAEGPPTLSARYRPAQAAR